MAKVDLSTLNMLSLETNQDAFVSSSKNVLGKGKKNRGPSLNVKGGGKSPAAKAGMTTPTKTSGKFGAKKSGHPQGKGNNKAIR